ncbi:MAG: diacylglycerol kinase family protein [Rhodospirillaceae bacterium]|nr:diacylglycerol kinase family protein [Rhodospirillaceae bacterium]
MAGPEPLMPMVVLTNPGSTANLADAGWLAALTAAERDLTELHARTPTEVVAAVARAVDMGAELIVVNGGDGTVDLVFGALLARKLPRMPAVAMLPAGKTNMTAAGWSLSGTKDGALRDLLAARRTAPHRLQTVQRPILRVDGGDQPLFGAFFGAADVVDGILFCRRHIYPLGLPNPVSHAAAISIMCWRALLGFTAQHLEADIGGERPARESGRFFCVIATTLDALLLGVQPAPANGGGPIHYLSLRPGPRALIAATPALLARRIDTGYRRTVRRADAVTLRFTGAYTLDGELHAASAERPVSVGVGGHVPIVRLRPP